MSVKVARQWHDRNIVHTVHVDDDGISIVCALDDFVEFLASRLCERVKSREDLNRTSLRTRSRSFAARVSAAIYREPPEDVTGEEFRTKLETIIRAELSAAKTLAISDMKESTAKAT